MMHTKVMNFKYFYQVHDAVSVGESNNFPHFWEGGVLHQDENRSDLVGEHVGVTCCGQVFPGQGHNVETGRQLVEETWMTYNQFQQKNSQIQKCWKDILVLSKRVEG